MCFHLERSSDRCHSELDLIKLFPHLTRGGRVRAGQRVGSMLLDLPLGCAVLLCWILKLSLSPRREK